MHSTMKFMRWMLACLACVSLTLFADDAAALKDEALQILKANSTKSVSPDEYAQCLFKLEKAQALLESSGDSNSSLAQEVSSSLFWARKFSNVQIVAALEALKKSSGVAALPPVPARTKSAPVVAAASKIEPPELLAARQAKAAYEAAETFASGHPKDEYATSLRFFQMASEHAGTEYALKALERARTLQMSVASKSGAASAEVMPETPEMALVKAADELVAEKKYEQAIDAYKKSLAMKETVIGHRHLAAACFKFAQLKSDEIKPKMEAHYAKYTQVYNGAWRTTNFGRVFDRNDPNLAHWQRELDDLRKESDVAQKNYQTAEQDFKAILKLSPEQKDFEAAGYLGLCQSVRPLLKGQGRQTLETFVKTYTPSTDAERALYEFCKTEIVRLKS